MDWVNANSGVIVLVMSVILIVLTAIGLWLLFYLKNKIAVQKLTFLGFYSMQLDERKSYAEFTVGNKALNDVGITEFGIRNGGVNFNITSLYRERAGLSAEQKIVIEQRSSVNFRLTAEELKKAIVVGKNGKGVVHTVRLYAVDVTGTLHQGKVGSVRKLLKELNIQELAAVRRAGAAQQAAERQPVTAPAEETEKLAASALPPVATAGQESLQEPEPEEEILA